jgi:hypothetical protein
LTNTDKYSAVFTEYSVAEYSAGYYSAKYSADRIVGRSLLATAHVAWVAAKAKGKVVAVVGLDLSAAFDTVGSEDLLPKMEAMGIRGKSIK